MHAWISKLFFTTLLLKSLCTWNTLDALPKQVIIIRHAEKYEPNGLYPGQLNPQGLRRAGALASFFTLSDPLTTNVVLFDNGPPTMLFAARPVDDGSNNTIRCIQTISTLAEALRTPIHAGFGYHQEQELANFILNSNACDNQNVLICWHHPKIGAIVEALGYAFPYNIYPSSRFDLVWYMPIFPAPSQPVILTPILQELLYGDSSTLP